MFPYYPCIFTLSEEQWQAIFVDSPGPQLGHWIDVRYWNNMWSTIWDPEIQDVQWHCFIWPMSHGLMHKLQRWITLCQSVRSHTSTLSHISNKYMNYCSLQQILLSAKKPNRPWKILLWFRTYSTLSSNLTSINIMPFHRKPNVFWQNDRMPHIHSGGRGSSCEQAYYTAVSGLSSCT